MTKLFKTKNCWQNLHRNAKFICIVELIKWNRLRWNCHFSVETFRYCHTEIFVRKKEWYASYASQTSLNSVSYTQKLYGIKTDNNVNVVCNAMRKEIGMSAFRLNVWVCVVSVWVCVLFQRAYICIYIGEALSMAWHIWHFGIVCFIYIVCCGRFVECI